MLEWINGFLQPAQSSWLNGVEDGGTEWINAELVPAILPSPPVASFVITPAFGSIGYIDFNTYDTSTGTPNLWTYTDGSTTIGIAQNSSSTIGAPAGSHTIQLTAGNAGGFTSATQTVTLFSNLSSITNSWEADFGLFNNFGLVINPGGFVSANQSVDLTKSDWTIAVSLLGNFTTQDVELVLWSQGATNGVHITTINHSSDSTSDIRVYFDGVLQGTYVGVSSFGVVVTYARTTKLLTILASANTADAQTFVTTANPDNGGIWYLAYDGSLSSAQTMGQTNVGIWYVAVSGPVLEDLVTQVFQLMGVGAGIGYFPSAATFPPADTIGLVGYWSLHESFNPSIGTDTLTASGSTTFTSFAGQPNVSVSGQHVPDWWDILGGVDIAMAGGATNTGLLYTAKSVNSVYGQLTSDSIHTYGKASGIPASATQTWFLVAKAVSATGTLFCLGASTAAQLIVSGGQYQWKNNSSGAAVSCGGTASNFNVICLRFTPGNLKVYINGTQTASFTPNAVYVTQSSFELFTNSSNSISNGGVFDVLQVQRGGAIADADVTTQTTTLRNKFNF